MAERVCPVWAGYLLANPIRKFFQHPKKILRSYIKEGMSVLDIGCAMGFFSLPMAQMVGSNGKVICIDMHEKMLKSLEKRVQKAELSDRIVIHRCHQDSLELQNYKEEIDFALIFAVAHEVPDTSRFFAEINAALKPNGIVLLAEPKGHVEEQDFEITIAVAQQNGFTVIANPHISRSLVVLLEKK